MFNDNPYNLKDVSKMEVATLRTLAEKYAQIASDPVHQTKAKMWQQLNDLCPNAKPMIWINEICWHEFDIERHLVCRHPFCRQLEYHFRAIECCWKNMPVDMIVDPWIDCPLEIEDSGFGMKEVGQQIIIQNGAVASRHFEPQIRTQEDIQKIKDPVVRHNQERTEQKYIFMQTIFKDILPVRKIGKPGFWFAPWDILVTWWGVQEALMDLIVKPDLVKAAMERLVDAHLARLDQYEKLNLLASNNGNFRIGSGGLGYTHHLPSAHQDTFTARDLWGCSTAQIFSEVSPEMHNEFALAFEKKWLERFGLNYYGCCEPLHNKIHYLKQIPNLRKISISPWANLEKAVEAIGTRYVISYKPNPAILAEEHWDAQRAKAILVNDLKKLKGCFVEIIMKDISTIRNEPRRLYEWSRIAEQVVQEIWR